MLVCKIVAVKLSNFCSDDETVLSTSCVASSALGLHLCYFVEPSQGPRERMLDFLNKPRTMNQHECTLVSCDSSDVTALDRSRTWGSRRLRHLLSAPWWNQDPNPGSVSACRVLLMITLLTAPHVTVGSSGTPARRNSNDPCGLRGMVPRSYSTLPTNRRGCVQ